MDEPASSFLEPVVTQDFSVSIEDIGKPYETMNDMKFPAILSMWLEFLSSSSDSASNCRRLGCRFRDEKDKMRNGEGKRNTGKERDKKL
ncbi:hypothetical protein K0M31_008753 [Melipona bicolor]|uniref:Uncharacterized protein n=1 Tax=Melipona bicolor TaxID=60889 RepID=A0AA40KK10_9HYME|nr:hypothetical protein K0M31_008753 [Melipona bicolor]